jgi:hypothetical protein
VRYFIIIITILVLSCSSGSNVESGNLSIPPNDYPVYRLSFQNNCEVMAINGLAHKVKCQSQLYILHYFFDIGDEPLVVGDSVVVEFIFETDEYSHERFTLIDIEMLMDDMDQHYSYTERPNDE